MSTGEQPIDASAIRRAERRRVGPEDQWVTTRMFCHGYSFGACAAGFCTIFLKSSVYARRHSDGII
jgi:hypothetical protein